MPREDSTFLHRCQHPHPRPSPPKRGRGERSSERSPPSLSCAVFALLVASTIARAEQPSPDGTATVAGTKTGQFHLEKIAGRHWFIDAEGRGFFALGVNHISAGMPREKREDQAWGKAVARQLRSWNFNCAGYAATPPALMNEMPFFAFINLAHCSHFLLAEQFWFDDVFDPSFQDDVRRRIRRVCAPLAKNPNLIGYYWTDTPEWDLDLARQHRGTDWVSSIRVRSSQTPGKQRYIKFLGAAYRDDVMAFNRAYGLAAPSFAWLLTHDFHGLDLKKPEVRRDDENFLGEIAAELYRVSGEAFRQEGGGHLICGDLYLQYRHTEPVLRAAARHVDLMLIQPMDKPGGPAADRGKFDDAFFENLHTLTGKPIMIGDHQFSFRTREHPVTMWQQFPTAAAAVQAHASYCQAAAAKPFVIGYMRCQYRSVYDPTQKMLKQGLLQTSGEPYPEYPELIARTNRRVLDQLFAKK